MVNLISAVKQGAGSIFCAGLNGANWVAELLANTPLPAEGLQEQIDKYRAFSCGADPVSDPRSVLQPPDLSNGAPGWTDTPYGTSGGIVRAFNVQFDRTTNPVRYRADKHKNLSTGACLGDFGWSNLQSPVGTPVPISGVICGSDSPPIEPVPPEPIDEYQEDIDVVYDDDTGSPVTLPDVPFRFFRPCINLDGIRVPFEVDLGFTKVCGKIGFRTDLTNILEPDIDIDQCPSEKEQLGYSGEQISEFFELSRPFGVSEPDWSGSPISASPRADKPALGAFVASRWTGANPEDSSQTRIIDPSGVAPDLLLPDIGMIRFLNQILLEDDQVEFAWSEPKKLQQVEQLVVNDWVHGAVDFQIQYRPGWTGELSLLYRKTCCESCKENDPNKDLDNLNRCRRD